MVEPPHPPYRYSFDDPYLLEPDPLYARLRRDEPVARVKLRYGQESWLVTRYDAVRAVLRDPRFSRAAAVGPHAPRSSPVFPQGSSMMDVDPPDHTRLRKLVAAAFTAARVEQLRPRAQEIADGLVAGMVADGPPVDLITYFAKPLPVTMICEILGVPAADRNRCFEWSVRSMSTVGPHEQVAQPYENLRGYLVELIAERREKPTADLLSNLVRACEGGQLTEDELVALARLLLVAGHETTVHHLANSVYALLTHPIELARLREDLSRIPRAVEELLRFVPLAAGAPASQSHARVATTDIELDEVTVPAGDAVLAAIISANRDERVFRDADVLDLSREHNPHVAFGHGTHLCLGSHLARMELQVSLATLLSRFPALRLAVPENEVRWKSGTLVRGPLALPLTW